MGIIRQLEDDRFFIQDESGSVPVDLSEAGTIAGFFVGGASTHLWTRHTARMPASSAPCPAAPLRMHWPCTQKAYGPVRKGCLSHFRARQDGWPPASVPGTQNLLSRCCAWWFGGRRQGRVGCAENCVVIAEGRLQHDGEMKVTALGMPPTEPREESQAAAQARCLLKKSQLVA